MSQILHFSKECYILTKLNTGYKPYKGFSLSFQEMQSQVAISMLILN